MVRLYKDPEGENMFTTQRSSQEKATTVVVEMDLVAQNKKLEQRITELETVLSQSLNQKQVIGTAKVHLYWSCDCQYSNVLTVCVCCVTVCHGCDLLLVSGAASRIIWQVLRLQSTISI